VRRASTVLLALASLLVFSASALAHDTVRGRLDIRHTDDMAHGKSSTRYTLHRSRKKRLAVRPTNAPNFRSGSRVIVRGRKDGRVIKGKVKGAPGVRAAGAGVLGDYRVAVLMFNFSDDRYQPWTPAAVSNRFFTASDSLDVYFKKQSYNQVNLEGDVYGWYELGLSGAGCDVDAWAAAAKAKAAAEGVVLSAYDSIAYVFPDQADCNWGGLAELPGNDLWLNGTISQSIAAHELGHNMGVHHASALACGSVAYSASCTKLEYGDPFSAMGTGSRRMASWHLQQLGYLQPSNVQTVTVDGTYSVRTTLNGSTDPQVLKIPRPAAGEYYYLDLRSGDGVFDSFLSTDPAVNGVTVRIGHGPTARLQSKLIDTTPGSYTNSYTDFTDAPLSVGRTFSDGNVTITTTGIADGVATVDVSWSTEPPDTTAPTAPVITAAAHGASYVDLNWNPATDNVGIAGYRVRRNGSTIATVSGTSYRDTRVRRSRTYNYCVEAFDAAGNATRSPWCWDSGIYVAPPVDPPPPPPETDGGSGDGAGGAPEPPDPPEPDEVDAEDPVITILAPMRNTKVRRGRKLRIRAGSSDNVGIVGLDLYVNGRRLASRGGPVLKLTWKVKRRFRVGRHKLVVVAHDAAGNRAKRSLPIRIRR
jgi:hypothetical protein